MCVWGGGRWGDWPLCPMRNMYLVRAKHGFICCRVMKGGGWGELTKHTTTHCLHYTTPFYVPGEASFPKEPPRLPAAPEPTPVPSAHAEIRPMSPTGVGEAAGCASAAAAAAGRTLLPGCAGSGGGLTLDSEPRPPMLLLLLLLSVA